jgi:hypothetical protein
MSGKSGRNGFSAVGSLFSGSLLRGTYEITLVLEASMSVIISFSIAGRRVLLKHKFVEIIVRLLLQQVLPGSFAVF